LQQQFLSCLIGIIIFVHCLAQAPDSTYQCQAFGDPHVDYWRLKDSVGGQQTLQHCYKAGPYSIVKNKFVNFQVTIENLWITDIQLIFYDGATRFPLCLITSDGFEIFPEDLLKCQRSNVTWNLLRSANGYTLNVAYSTAKFLTEITHDLASRNYNPHYNIFVWEPKALVDVSTGICTRNDPQCSTRSVTDESMFEHDSPLPQQRAITHQQARSICQANINGYLSKTRRAPYQRSLSMNSTIEIAKYGCETDLMMTGFYQAATSSLGVLVVEELTGGLTSIDTIHNAIKTGAQDAFEVFHEAAKEVEAEVLEIMGLPTPTTVKTTTAIPTSTKTTTTIEAVTTTSPPRAGFKCSVYQNMYIQTWHPTNEAIPPSRTCSSTTPSFELVKNKYVRYTLTTAGSAISELSLILFDGLSPNAICTVIVLDTNPQWMDCEKHGIKPAQTTTATHSELLIYYAKANFTTVIKQDIGINIGRFNIDIYQNPELALQSSGACNLISSCLGTTGGQ